jgi:DNA-binding transcriptional ArsR family regulator
MKPLVHPAAEDISVEGILHALADPVRLRIFTQLACTPAPLSCTPFLEVDGRPVPKSTLSQHFRVLREAGLVRSERHGVEMRNTVRFEDLQPRFAPLLQAIMDAHQAQSAPRKSVSAKRARAKKSA